ncbi:MAG: CpaE family protein [Candidatus Limnocylindrales bacterium]|jgi:pilus assembly protein CpaE
MSSSSDQIRLLLVEDVPQVAQYVRGLLNAQAQIKLLDVVSDGRKVPDLVREGHPDVVMIDALLQGKIRGLTLAAQLRQDGLATPIIVLTVPQNPIASDPGRGIDAVLSMPFSGFELINLLQAMAAQAQAERPEGRSRVYSIFAPKGGVGKTTIAFNLAVALRQTSDVRTALVDGSLQFGDMRSLLRVPADAPSILDLPTDRISESDLSDVLWRDPSGIDILLAPPRVEMHEMLSVRDVDKVLSILRRVYPIIVVDTPASVGEMVMAFLDASDLVIEIVTYDSTTIVNTRAMAEFFRAIGYPPTKVRYLLNRADSTGGIDPAALAEALGREPEFSLISDGRLVVESNNQGVPFVLADPAARISADMAAIAHGVRSLTSQAVATAGKR